MPKLAAARVALAVAYPLLAHWASHDGGPPVAALALLDLAVIVLLQALAARRVWAWTVLAGVVAGLILVARAEWLLLVLLAPPVLFTAALSWVFARTLRPGRIPLVTRIAAAIEYGRLDDMPLPQQRYTRTLTALWAGLLAGIAVANTVLALVAEPSGILVRLGHPLSLGVSQQAWSWFANILDYGLVAAFMVGEYVVRCLRFPDRPVRSLPEFARRMAALGPDFWRRLPE